jgi:hypothetical protein
MVILADDTLETFFDRTFAESIHLSPSPTSTPGAPAAVGGVRGLFDGLVNDGMRVATEVRRRMDEAGKIPTQNKEEDDEEDGEGVREGDRELLNDAPGAGKKEEGEGIIPFGEQKQIDLLDGERTIEFEGVEK